jgi:hypothetical protein
VLLTVASLYYHRSLQELILFLAFISTASWVAVLLTTFVRFSVQYKYKRRTSRFGQIEEEQA